MSQLETQNKQAVKQKETKTNGPNVVIVRQINISLPPFNVSSNEPYGDNQSLKFVSQFQSDEVLDKLNEFADSTIQFGEQLLKRLLQTEQELMLDSEDAVEDTEGIINEENKEHQVGTSQS